MHEGPHAGDQPSCDLRRDITPICQAPFTAKNSAVLLVLLTGLCCESINEPFIASVRIAKCDNIVFLKAYENIAMEDIASQQSSSTSKHTKRITPDVKNYLESMSCMLSLPCAQIPYFRHRMV
jgi:hypothetical protein